MKKIKLFLVIIASIYFFLGNTMAHAGQLECTGNDIGGYMLGVEIGQDGYPSVFFISKDATSTGYYLSSYNNTSGGKNMLSVALFALASGMKVRAFCADDGTVRDFFISPNAW
ncbi:hypothetical protein [Xenorhabdus griffiniae]|uniref:hypothetical protein n=1 Tax=Xenorhabdus griffiniae TaxID=351672 RepID=UPI0023590750|nr:hypothetical protein [Xenorhabdus griffiniae]MDC9603827.1 hypothetical protein [Xenorhabdus griffiniae]